MRKRNILTLALLVVYLGMVGWCCFGHFSDLPDIGQDNLFGIPMDKVVHFLMFFPFPILCYLAFSGMTGRPRHTVLAVGLVFSGRLPDRRRDGDRAVIHELQKRRRAGFRGGHACAGHFLHHRDDH